MISIRQWSLSNIGVTTFGDDVFTEKVKNKQKPTTFNQPVSERTYPSEAVLRSVFLISPFYEPTPGSGVLLHGHGDARAQNDAFRCICKLLHSVLLTSLPFIFYHTIEHEYIWSQINSQATTGFTSCHNDKNNRVYLGCSSLCCFQNRRKSMTLALTINLLNSIKN